MKWFGSKLKSSPKDYSFLGCDMHSHLLPGIDDGSPDLDSTLTMLAKMQQLGYRKIITTPHVKWDYFKNSTEIIRQSYLNILPIVQGEFPELTFEFAAEYYIDEHFMNLLATNDLLSFSGNKILVEYNFLSPPMFHERAFFELQNKGYQPILAHFERYPYYHGKIEVAEKLREQGVWIQMNINSLSGHYGKEVRQQAEKLVTRRAVDLVGSDCHRMQHLETMEGLLGNKFVKILSDMELRNSGI